MRMAIDTPRASPQSRREQTGLRRLLQSIATAERYEIAEARGGCAHSIYGPQNSENGSSSLMMPRLSNVGKWA